MLLSVALSIDQACELGPRGFFLLMSGVESEAFLVDPVVCTLSADDSQRFFFERSRKGDNRCGSPSQVCYVVSFVAHKQEILQVLTRTILFLILPWYC